MDPSDCVMDFRTVEQIDLGGKRVLMRVDFNVPLDKQTGRTIRSDTRVRMALPTLRAVLGQGAAIVLVSHLGRPKGRPHPKMSLRPVADRLSGLLRMPVAVAPDCVGPKAESIVCSLQPGDVALLENLRFHAGEEANDASFAAQLARLGDAYVNDAFGTAHRAHASTVGVAPHFQDRAAGLLMQREFQYLSMATSAPRNPYVAIIGGAKISGKIDVIRNLLKFADTVLIGGAMTYTFLKAKGVGVGASLVESDKVGLAADLLASAGDRIELPVDHIVAKEFSADSTAKSVHGSVPDGWMGLDIGPQTARRYEEAISQAEMIVWNGPMGVFEFEAFAGGTIAVARAVEAASEHAVSIVGGGDSERAIRAAGVGQRISHISTGGGASLDFLSGKQLPGFVALG